MSTSQLRRHLIDAYRRDEPALTIELALLCIADEPADRTVLLIYGDALTSVARHSEALEVYREALELSSGAESTRVELQLAKLYDQWGKHAEAEHYYRGVIEKRPHHTSAYIHLGAMLATMGRLAEAEELHRCATACADGEIAEAYLNLALVHRARRDYLGALVSLRKAIELDPHYEEAKDTLVDIQRVLFEFPAVDTQHRVFPLAVARGRSSGMHGDRPMRDLLPFSDYEATTRSLGARTAVVTAVLWGILMTPWLISARGSLAVGTALTIGVVGSLVFRMHRDSRNARGRDEDDAPCVRD